MDLKTALQAYRDYESGRGKTIMTISEAILILAEESPTTTELFEVINHRLDVPDTYIRQELFALVKQGQIVITPKKHVILNR